jgi:hypothetical protein
MLRRSLVCPDCHTTQQDWDEDPDAFLGDLYTCEGCARVQQEQRNIPEGEMGMHARLLPREAALARVSEGKGVI